MCLGEMMVTICLGHSIAYSRMASYETKVRKLERIDVPKFIHNAREETLVEKDINLYITPTIGC